MQAKKTSEILATSNPLPLHSIKEVISLFRNVAAVLSLIVMMLVTSTAYSYEACDYYVDSEAGNDAYTGKATAYDGVDGPLKSMWGVTTKSVDFTGGDRICFRKGQRFYYVNNGALRSSGDAVNGSIVYTSYGLDGESKPVLSISRETNPDATNGKVWNLLNDGTDRYQYDYGRCYVSGLWEDGVPLKRVSTVEDVIEDGDWYFPVFAVYTDCTSTDSSLRNIVYKPRNLGGEIGYTLDGRSVMMANNGYVFGLNHPTTKESLSYITFDGLSFEYAGQGIVGSGRGISNGEVLTVHHITVQNSDFSHIIDGIRFNSFTENSIAHENHHLSVINNRFSDIRFAASFMADARGGSDATERHFDIDITGNIVRDVSLNGNYVVTHNDTSPDIEVFRFQNPWDLSIIGNDIRHGVKISDGIEITLSNSNLAVLHSAGIIIWHRATSPQQFIKRINIHNNRIDDIGRGMGIGSGVALLVEDLYISNNIITNSEMGFRFNSGAVDAMLNPIVISHNTLVGNGDSINVFSNGTGYQFKNNISAWPTNSHITVAQLTGFESTQFDYNLFVDDNAGTGLFHFTDYAQVTNFEDWKNDTNRDPNSGIAIDAGFSGGNLQTLPDDNPDNGTTENPVIAGSPYQLLTSSDAINAGTDSGVTLDFFGATRVVIPDIGADEFVDSDQDDFEIPADCNDNDSSVYPGALETSLDGIDQNCNGGDATIEVLKATYRVNRKGQGTLEVEATVAGGQSDQLTVENYGLMGWARKQGGKWVLKDKNVPDNPGVIRVTGAEGTVEAIVTN